MILRKPNLSLIPTIGSAVLALLFIGLCLERGFSVSTPEEISVAGPANNHAVVVGIEDYRDWKKLQDSKKNAGEFRDLLISHYGFQGGNILFLTDDTAGRPTGSNLTKAIEKAAQSTTPSDNLIVYFSGHGAVDPATRRGYWVPIDGKPDDPDTWLAHNKIAEILTAPGVAAGDICIVADSNFSASLLNPWTSEISMGDFKYRTWVLDKARQPSREVIAFGEMDPRERARWKGLFTQYLIKALRANKFKIMDPQSLFFEKVMIPLEGVAGVKTTRGRIRSAADKGGELVLVRTAQLPPVNIVDVNVSPGRGYVGKSFVFRAKTDAGAAQVTITIDGKEYPMNGSGVQWSGIVPMHKKGKMSYTVIAVNEDGIAGSGSSGTFMVVDAPVLPVDVTSASVTPEQGDVATPFAFKAATDSPAKEVYVDINGVRHGMHSASGYEWELQMKMNEVGTYEYLVVALNEEEMEGELSSGSFDAVIELTAESRFVDNGDGTITDRKTNLMWLKTGRTVWRAIAWEDAMAYCEKLDAGGHTGWRLPTEEEWKMMADARYRNPALPEPSPFSNVVTFSDYWSKTDYVAGPGYAWAVNLYYGKMKFLNKKKYAFVWPVRYVGEGIAETK